MRQADCNATLIDVITKYSSLLEQTSKEKEKEKIEKFNTDWIFYLAGGFVIIVCFGFFFTYKSINKNAAVFNAILKKLNSREITGNNK